MTRRDQDCKCKGEVHASAREKFKNGLIDVVYCNTENMIADALTKPLNKNRFLTLRDKLGLLESQ